MDFHVAYSLGLQRIGTNQSFPWLLDSFLCIGVILHGVCNSKPEFNSYIFSFFGLSHTEVRLDFIYLVAGYYSYMCSLALSPYKVFYAMAIIGAISLTSRILQKRTREKLEPHFGGRKHSHRHWKQWQTSVLSLRTCIFLVLKKMVQIFRFIMVVLATKLVIDYMYLQK